MKKLIILTIAFLLSIAGAYAQWVDPCGDQSDWDWTVSISDTNWQAYLTDGIENLGSPFNSPASGDIRDIEISEDYLPENGWLLLLKNFGCETQSVQGDRPYFVLYNRYRGIIRMFQHNSNGGDYNGALMTLKWGNASQETSLLTFNNTDAKVDNYYAGPESRGDFAVNYVQSYFVDGAWYATDYSIAFDHNTSNTKFYDLNFTTFNVLTQSISIRGDLEFSTKSAAFTGSSSQKEPEEESGEVLKWLKKGSKFLGKIPSKKDMKKKLDSTSNTINDCSNWVCNNLGESDAGTNFAYGLTDLSEEISPEGTLGEAFSTVATAATSLNVAFKVLIPVVKFFTGQVTSTSASNPSPFQPSVSSGTLSLSGSIRTESNGTSVFMQLPGGNHPDGISNFPYYDCPLGVLSLEEEPEMTVKKVKTTERRHYINVKSTPWTTHGVCADTSKYIVYHTDNDFVTYKSVKIDNVLKLAINDASGLELVEAKASLVCQIEEEEGRPAYFIGKSIMNHYAGAKEPILKLDENYLATHGAVTYIPSTFPSGSIPSHLVSICGNPDLANTSVEGFVNTPIKKAIRDQTYILNVVDTENLLHTYSTPLIPLSKFRNTSVFVPQETKITVKIQALMRVKNKPNAAPVIIVQSYDLNEAEMNSLPEDSQPFKFTSEQLSERLFHPDGYPNVIDDYLIDPATIPLPSFTFTNGHWAGVNVTTANEVNMDIENAPVHESLQNGTITAWNSIEMNPGFSATAKDGRYFLAVIAKGYRGEPITIGTNAQDENVYFKGCAPDESEGGDTGEGGDINPGGGQEPQKEKVFIAYPNPTSGSLTIELLNADKLSGMKVQITNMEGLVLMEKEFRSKKVSVDMSGLRKGIYVCNVMKNNRVISRKKVIKE